MTPLLAPALRRGDRVAVVAPSSPVFGDPLEEGLSLLRSWGYTVVEGEHLRAVRGHLAGTDDERLADLSAAVRDPSVRAVLAARGGAGLQRIVDRVPWEDLRADPKLLVGFSDTTALLQAAWRRLRLVTVHGQFAGRLHLQAPAGIGRLRTLLAGGAPPPVALPEGSVVASGRADGPLLGGNLALLCAGAGTPDQLDADGAIVLLEDVNEPPYAIDRMLTQLRRAGVVQRAAGFVVGAWRGCDPPPGRPSASAAEVVADRLGDLGVPVVSGLPVGHTDAQVPLPHGARVVLDTRAGELAFPEPAADPG